VADLSHERERLRQGVDTFIDSFEKHGDFEDARIDIFGVVAIVTWKEEGADAETPFMWFESRRNYVQLGVLRTCTMELESSYYYQDVTTDEDEEE
jgi:hypothetical protein